jgi:hypothetical protein
VTSSHHKIEPGEKKEDSEGLGLDMQHLAVAFGCGEAFCRSGLWSCSRRFGCRFCYGDNNNDSCYWGVTGDHSCFLFRVGTVSGALIGSVTRDNGCSCDLKKKRLDLFFFVAGQSQSHIAIGLRKEAPE